MNSFIRINNGIRQRMAEKPNILKFQIYAMSLGIYCCATRCTMRTMLKRVEYGRVAAGHEGTMNNKEGRQD